MQERELSHKLDSLFAKGLYGIALNIAEADQARLNPGPISSPAAIAQLQMDVSAASTDSV